MCVIVQCAVWGMMMWWWCAGTTGRRGRGCSGAAWSATSRGTTQPSSTSRSSSGPRPTCRTAGEAAAYAWPHAPASLEVVVRSHRIDAVHKGSWRLQGPEVRVRGGCEEGPRCGCKEGAHRPAHMHDRCGSPRGYACFRHRHRVHCGAAGDPFEMIMRQARGAEVGGGGGRGCKGGYGHPSPSGPCRS